MSKEVKEIKVKKEEAVVEQPVVIAQYVVSILDDGSRVFNAVEKEGQIHYSHAEIIHDIKETNKVLENNEKYLELKNIKDTIRTEVSQLGAELLEALEKRFK